MIRFKLFPLLVLLFLALLPFKATAATLNSSKIRENNERKQHDLDSVREEELLTNDFNLIRKKAGKKRKLCSKCRSKKQCATKLCKRRFCVDQASQVESCRRQRHLKRQKRKSKNRKNKSKKSKTRKRKNKTSDKKKKGTTSIGPQSPPQKNKSPKQKSKKQKPKKKKSKKQKPRKKKSKKRKTKKRKSRKQKPRKKKSKKQKTKKKKKGTKSTGSQSSTQKKSSPKKPKQNTTTGKSTCTNCSSKKPCNEGICILGLCAIDWQGRRNCKQNKKGLKGSETSKRNNQKDASLPKCKSCSRSRVCKDKSQKCLFGRCALNIEDRLKCNRISSKHFKQFNCTPCEQSSQCKNGNCVEGVCRSNGEPNECDMLIDSIYSEAFIAGNEEEFENMDGDSYLNSKLLREAKSIQEKDRFQFRENKTSEQNKDTFDEYFTEEDEDIEESDVADETDEYFENEFNAEDFEDINNTDDISLYGEEALRQKQTEEDMQFPFEDSFESPEPSNLILE